MKRMPRILMLPFIAAALNCACSCGNAGPARKVFNSTAKISPPAEFPQTQRIITLTEEQIIQLALQRSPERAVARKQAKAAAAYRRTELLPSNPELRAGLTREAYRATEEYDPPDDYRRTRTFGIRFSPPHPVVFRHDRKRLDLQTEAAQAEFLSLEYALILDIRNLLLDLRETTARIGLARRRAEIRRQKRVLARERSEYRQATIDNVAVADAAWLNALDEIDTLELRQARLRRRLAEVTGLNGQRYEIAPPEKDNLESAVSALLQESDAFERNRHPDVAAARAHARAAGAALGAERARRIPWLSHVQVAHEQDNRDNRGDAWSLQAAMEIPIFSAPFGGAAQARADNATARARLQAAITRAAFEIDEAAADLAECLQAYRRTRQRNEALIDELETALEITEQPDTGADPMAPLRIKDMLLGAEASLLAGRFELERANIRLKTAIHR